MPGDGKQIAANALYVDRDLARRLHRVGVEVNIGLGGDLADLFHRLQHAGFIVGHHDGDQPGVRPQRPAHVVGIDLASAVHRNVGDFAARCFQMLARVQHGMMLDGRGDDMLSGFGETKNCQVVGFGATAGEHDLRSAASQQSGHRLARTLHRRPRLLSMMMDGRRVPKTLPEVGLHGLKDRGQDGVVALLSR